MFNEVFTNLEPSLRELAAHGGAYKLPGVSEIVRDGIHLRSREDGRYLLLRGVCFGPSAKYAPFLSVKSPNDWPRIEPYLDLLLASGLYTLRLAFSWEGLEPHCDPKKPKFEKAYLDAFFDVAEHLTKKGFIVFIDVHQDLVQAAWGGNGFPHWVKEDGAQDGATMMNTPLWGLNYVMNKGLRKTFTHFWQNDLTNSRVTPPLNHFKVRDRFLDVIDALAERASENDRIFGIEVINEPHPAELDPERFEVDVLAEFYKQAGMRIRKFSSEMFLMAAPQSDWNANLREDKNYRSMLPMSDQDDDRIAFAYHYYDSLLTGLHGLHFHERKREEYLAAIAEGVNHARRLGIVPFLTEFGTRQNWLRHVTRRHMHWHFEAVERALVHATYWNVNFYNTKRDRDGFMREDFSLFDENLKPRNFDLVVRPYPLAASARPTSFSFNDRTRTVELTLEGKPVNAPTVIYLPFSKEAHRLVPTPFAKGFKVYYASARPKSEAYAIPEANQLHIMLDPDAERHHIMIVPLDEYIIANPEQLVMEFRA